MKSLIAALLALPLLAGCLSDYEHYTKAIAEQAKWKATADIATADAFKAAVESDNPVVAAVAANGLGIAQALRTSGRGGSGDAPIQAPKSLYDYAALGSNFLLGAGGIAAQFNATNRGAAVAMKQIEGDVAIQQAQSAERVSIFNRYGQTAEALGGFTRDTAVALGRNLENVGKEPRNVTNTTVNGNNNATAVNDSRANNTQTTVTETTTTTTTDNSDRSNRQGGQ